MKSLYHSPGQCTAWLWQEPLLYVLTSTVRTTLRQYTDWYSRVVLTYLPNVIHTRRSCLFCPLSLQQWRLKGPHFRAGIQAISCDFSKCSHLLAYTDLLIWETRHNNLSLWFGKSPLYCFKYMTTLALVVPLLISGLPVELMFWSVCSTREKNTDYVSPLWLLQICLSREIIAAVRQPGLAGDASNHYSFIWVINFNCFLLNKRKRQHVCCALVITCFFVMTSLNKTFLFPTEVQASVVGGQISCLFILEQT